MDASPAFVCITRTGYFQQNGCFVAQTPLLRLRVAAAKGGFCDLFSAGDLVFNRAVVAAWSQPPCRPD